MRDTFPQKPLIVAVSEGNVTYMHNDATLSVEMETAGPGCKGAGSPVPIC